MKTPVAPHSLASIKLRLPTHRGPCYGGNWHEPKSGRTIEQINPGTGESLGHAADCSTDDIDAAVNAAKAAFKEWRRVPPFRGADLLHPGNEHQPGRAESDKKHAKQNTRPNGPAVSILGLSYVGVSPETYGPSDDAVGIATIRAVVNAGVTLIDTAISTAWVIKDVGTCRPQTKLRLPRVSFVSGPPLSYASSRGWSPRPLSGIFKMRSEKICQRIAEREAKRLRPNRQSYGTIVRAPSAPPSRTTWPRLAWQCRAGQARRTPAAMPRRAFGSGVLVGPAEYSVAEHLSAGVGRGEHLTHTLGYLAALLLCACGVPVEHLPERAADMRPVRRGSIGTTASLLR